jgi:hypothetical protein
MGGRSVLQWVAAAREPCGRWNITFCGAPGAPMAWAWAAGIVLGRASDRLAGSYGFAHGLRAGAEQTQTD